MREFLTPKQLRSLVVTDGWDKDFVETLIAYETGPGAIEKVADSHVKMLGKHTHVSAPPFGAHYTCDP